jgi:hypothetical protein
MRPSRIIGIALFLALLCCTINAEAKWWIFGTSEDEVETSYLYLNRVAFNETGTKVTLYRDMLPNGMITIQGKALAGRNRIGSVRISLDAKESWLDVKFSENGAFEYGFRPDMGKTYKVYVEVTDTTGKTNKIDATYKEVTISDMNIQAVVSDALNKLIDAYQRENAAQFMALVSDDFTAGKVILDRAIRGDFRLFDNIRLRYTLNNVTSDASGKVFVMLTYNWQAVVTRTGQILQPSNTSTQFTFRLGDRGLQVWDMKFPLIFGVSDPSNVATGTANVGSNEKVVFVDAKGNVSLIPLTQAAQAVQSGTTSESGGPLDVMFRFNGALPPTAQGFTFSTGQVTTATGTEDIVMGQGALFFKGGTGHINLGVRAIDTVTSVPTSGYNITPEIFDLGVNIGHSFAMKLANGKYGVLYIQNYTATAPGPTQIFRLTVKFRYQPDGTPNF